MSALGQALAKAGIVEKEKAANIDKERDEALKKHKQASDQIWLMTRERRYLNKMRGGIAKMVRNKDFNSIHNATLYNDICRFIGIPAINLEAKANRNFALNLIQEQLTMVDKVVRPLISSNKKLEREWGFKRDL